MLASVWRLSLFLALSLPVVAQHGSGGNIPVSSSDLGYRLGSIEAKIENQGKALDELKGTVQKTNESVQKTSDNLAALTVEVKRTSSNLGLLSAILAVFGSALITGLFVPSIRKTFFPDPPSFDRAPLDRTSIEAQRPIEQQRQR